MSTGIIEEQTGGSAQEMELGSVLSAPYLHLSLFPCRPSARLSVFVCLFFLLSMGRLLPPRILALFLVFFASRFLRLFSVVMKETEEEEGGVQRRKKRKKSWKGKKRRKSFVG